MFLIFGLNARDMNTINCDIHIAKSLKNPNKYISFDFVLLFPCDNDSLRCLHIVTIVYVIYILIFNQSVCKGWKISYKNGTEW